MKLSLSKDKINVLYYYHILYVGLKNLNTIRILTGWNVPRIFLNKYQCDVIIEILTSRKECVLV